jgi:biopolymer transport protein ExbD
MGFKSTDLEDSISDINVVPLVDIILVVLIIFMVTAPMFLKPSININLPKAASGESTQKTLLNISIAASGVISLNGSISNEDKIKEKAMEVIKSNPEVQAVIAADKDVPHGRVVSIIDIVKTAGVKKFAISIDKVVGQ